MTWRSHLEPGPVDAAVHVWPDDDLLVEHELVDAGCPCGPQVEHFPNGNRLIVHASLDGRELSEPRD